MIVVTPATQTLSVTTPLTVSVIEIGLPGPAGTNGNEGPLASLSDVAITAPADDHVLQFNNALSKWTNRPKESLVDGGNF